LPEIFFSNFGVSPEALKNEYFQHIMQNEMDVFSSNTNIGYMDEVETYFVTDLKRKLSEAEHISLIADSWDCPFHKNFFGVMAVFLTPEMPLKHLPILLQVEHNSTSEYYECAIKSRLLELELPMEKIVSITTDGASNILKTCRLLSINQVYCFNHLLNLAFREFLNHEEIFFLIEQVEDIVQYYGRKNKGKKNQLCDEDGNPFLIPSFSEIRWISIGKTLRNIIKNLGIINSALLEELGTYRKKLNSYSVHVADTARCKIEKLRTMLLGEDQVQLLKLISEVVDKTEILHAVAERNSHSICENFPLYCKTVTSLQELLDSSAYRPIHGAITHFRSRLSSRVRDCIRDKDIHILSCMYHPRYKSLIHTIIW
jgi:hypothetical protein